MLIEQSAQYANSIMKTIEFLEYIIPILKESEKDNADAFGIAGSLDVNDILDNALESYKALSVLVSRLSHIGEDVMKADPMMTGLITGEFLKN